MRVTAIAAIGVLAAPAAAFGAGVEVVEHVGTQSTAELRFRAESSEANKLTVTQRVADADHFEVELLDKRAPISAGPGCSGGGAANAAVKCVIHRPREPRYECVTKTSCVPVPGVGWSTSMTIVLGDGGSALNSTAVPDLDQSVSGGSGSDEIITGPRSDTINPGTGRDQVSTGSGADSIVATSAPDGPDVYALGSGDDVPAYVHEIEYDGDSVDYGPRDERVIFEADGLANDGSPGEEDMIVDAEAVKGGAGDDLLVGDGNYGALLGGVGNDRLLGRGGTDVLRGDEGDDVLDGGGEYDELRSGREDRGADLALGGGGGDSISLGDGADRALGGEGGDSITLGAGDDTGLGGAGDDGIAGESGADRIEGGAGDDTINGGLGPDRLAGEAGDDSLIAGIGGSDLFRLPPRFLSGPLDSWRDRVECGSDQDAALVNPWDSVLDCEQVLPIRVVGLERPRYRQATRMFLLPVWAWSAGRLVLYGADVEEVVRLPKEDGEVRLPLELEGSALRTLRRHGRVTVQIGIRFRPEVGIARTMRTMLKLVRPERSIRGH